MTPPLHSRPTSGDSSSASGDFAPTSDTDTLSRLPHEALVALVKARLRIA